MTTLLPALLLLCWSAIAATTLTLWVLAPILGEDTSALSLAPRHPATGQSVLLALLVLPIFYGLAFRVLGGATLRAGLLAGGAHAAVLALRSLRADGVRGVRANTARIVLCLIYGVLLGSIFVTP